MDSDYSSYYQRIFEEDSAAFRALAANPEGTRQKRLETVLHWQNHLDSLSDSFIVTTDNVILHGNRSVALCGAYNPNTDVYALGGLSDRITLAKRDGSNTVVDIGASEPVSDICWLSDQLIFCAAGGSSTLVSVPSAPSAPAPAPASAPAAVRATCAGNKLLFTNSVGLLHLWDPLSPPSPPSPLSPRLAAPATCVASDGGVLAAAGAGDGAVCTIDLRSGNRAHTLPPLSATVSALVFNPHKPYLLAAAGVDGSIVISDLRTTAPAARLAGAGAGVREMTWQGGSEGVLVTSGAIVGAGAGAGAGAAVSAFASWSGEQVASWEMPGARAAVGVGLGEFGVVAGLRDGSVVWFN